MKKLLLTMTICLSIAGTSSAQASLPCASIETFRPIVSVPQGDVRATAAVDPNCYTWIVPESGTVGLWHRVIALNSNADSFYVSINGGPEFIDDACERRWPCAGTKWSPLTNRNANGGVESTTPYAVTLVKGATMTLRFRVREAGTQILELGVGTPPLTKQQPLSP